MTNPINRAPAKPRPNQSWSYSAGEDAWVRHAWQNREELTLSLDRATSTIMT